MSAPRIPALAAAAILGLAAGLTATAQTSQQMLMKQCNVEASTRHLMGRSRQSFMQTCLRSPAKRHMALNSQQRRMKDCNAQANTKGLKGTDRRRYVNSCLRLR